MQTKRWKRSLTLVVCIVLVAAMALFTTGCSDKTPNTPDTPDTPDTAPFPGGSMGTGDTAFSFTVVDGEGKETVFDIHTDKTMVGEALEELGLIEGEEGPYGLYVKTVNGLTVDYDTDGKYWAFYVGEEASLTGVDLTEITPDAAYAFKVE